VEARIVMSRKEIRRLELVNRFLEGTIDRRKVAELLELSERQISRIAGRIKKYGAESVVHKARGRRSNNMLEDKTRERVIKLCQKTYAGFGPTLAAEKLEKRNRIKVSRETLRGWLCENNLPYRKRRKKPHRQWRERRACFGEMVQLDGSTHDWFDGRRPECTLMGYIDDATGISYARFYEYEGTIPAMDGFRRYAAKYGLPASVYLDRHSTYKGRREPTLEEELNGEGPLSHFQRSLKELGIQVIHAHSPQAKGRIERYFGTSQDRLIKELTLAGISTIDAANAFLEETYLKEHNTKYSKAARDAKDLHLPYPGYQVMLRTLTIRDDRVVKNDSTVWWEGRVFLLKDRTWAKKVTVQQRLDGKIAIRDRNRDLRHEDITRRVKETGELPKSNLAARPPRGAVRVRDAHLTWT
jgi:transposase